MWFSRQFCNVLCIWLSFEHKRCSFSVPRFWFARKQKTKKSRNLLEPKSDDCVWKPCTDILLRWGITSELYENLVHTAPHRDISPNILHSPMFVISLLHPIYNMRVRSLPTTLFTPDRALPSSSISVFFRERSEFIRVTCDVANHLRRRMRNNIKRRKEALAWSQTWFKWKYEFELSNRAETKLCSFICWSTESGRDGGTSTQGFLLNFTGGNRRRVDLRKIKQKSRHTESKTSMALDFRACAFVPLPAYGRKERSSP